MIKIFYDDEMDRKNMTGRIHIKVRIIFLPGPAYANRLFAMNFPPIFKYAQS